MELSALLEKKSGKGVKLYRYDEAIELTGNGKIQLVTFIVFAACIICVMLEGTSMAYALPMAKCDLNISLREQGLINSVGYFGIVLTSHIWGFFADTKGRRKVLLVSTLFTFIFGAASSFANSGLMMFITRLAVGMCVSALQPCMVSYLSELHCQKNKTKYLSQISVFIAIANLLQAVINIAYTAWGFELVLLNGLFLYKPWRLYLLTISLVPLTCFFAILYLPESPKFLLSRGDVEGSIAVLKKIHFVNHQHCSETPNYAVTELVQNEGEVAISPDVGILSMLWNQTKPLFVQPYLTNITLISINSFILYMVGYGLFLWFPQIISIYQKNMDVTITICEALSMKSSSNNTTNSTATDNSLTNACGTTINSFTFLISLLMSVLSVVLNIGVAYLLTRVGKKAVLSGFFTLGIIAALMALLPHTFYMSMVCLSFITKPATCATLVYSISSSLFPTKYNSMAIGLIIMIGRLGAVFGTNLYGYLLANYCQSSFYFMSVTYFTSIILTVLILRKVDRIESEL